MCNVRYVLTYHCGTGAEWCCANQTCVARSPPCVTLCHVRCDVYRMMVCLTQELSGVVPTRRILLERQILAHNAYHNAAAFIRIRNSGTIETFCAAYYADVQTDCYDDINIRVQVTAALP